MKLLFYYFVKIYIKTGLFFYSKKITVNGLENIPKKGAVLFAANHPNGLIDPLLIATSIQRKVHFLVRAAVFKKPLIAKIFDWIGMMPVYRIRDGFNQLNKNKAIFSACENLLKNKKCLLIFPEGSHLEKRTIRPLSKGFTRIVFGALEQHPTTEISIIPVGITYQKSSFYPSEVTLNFGKAILANSFYNKDEPHNSTNLLKDKVSSGLKKCSVHITDNDNYKTILEKMNTANVDFTKIKEANKMIAENNFYGTRSKPNKLSWIKTLIKINSFLPLLIWKKISKKIDEIEFVDTFRFGANIVTFPVFYSLQSWVISIFFGYKIAVFYFLFSILLVLFYTKKSNH